MKNVRKILNGVSLAVLCVGALAIDPATGSADLAPVGHTCCPDFDVSCYSDRRNEVGVVIRVSGAVYEATSTCPLAAS